MHIWIDVDSTNNITGWGSSPVSDNSIEIEVNDDHPILTAFGRYSYIEGELVEDLSNLLGVMKKEKDIELNKACRDAILSGFNHVIDGISYHFSFDTEAQLNFQGSDRLLSEGVVNEVMWTVRRGDVYTRIPITKTIMSEIAMTILIHKNVNISKYRDILMPMVNRATTVEEVEDITWDGMFLNKNEKPNGESEV